MKKMKRKTAHHKAVRKAKSIFVFSRFWIITFVITLFVIAPFDIQYLLNNFSAQQDVLGAKTVCNYKVSKDSHGCIVTKQVCGSRVTTSTKCSSGSHSSSRSGSGSSSSHASIPKCAGACTSLGICRVEGGHTVAHANCSASTVCCSF